MRQAKKYVDDNNNEAKFKDDSTETSDVDLRRDKTNSISNFYDDVEFKKKAKCKDLNVLSSSNEIVNKNSLETGGLVGIQSLNYVVQGLLTQLGKTELVIIKGNPTSKSILKKHTPVNGNPSLTKDGDSVTLDITFGRDLPDGIYKYIFDLYFNASRDIKIFLYGECGGTGYNATTRYSYWDGNYDVGGSVLQNNVNGGYFHRVFGQRITVTGEFRNRLKNIKAIGVSYANNGSDGRYNKFTRQDLTAVSSEPKLLGLHMTWVFENETNAALGMTTDSYFYVERINTI